MGEESVKGANMGVILIIFAAILALGLIVFMLARNMANEGLTNVSERLEAASNSEFSDFDQKVVVGQRIIAAMNSFKGKRVTVLVATQGLIDKVATPLLSFQAATGSGEERTPFPVPLAAMEGMGSTGPNQILDATAVIQGHEQMYFAFGVAPARNPDNSVNRQASQRTVLPASSSGNSNDKILTFVQYNAVLEATDNTGVVAPATGNQRNSVVWWNDDHYAFSGGYRSDDAGKTVFDYIWANTTRTGTTEVIPAAARFHANLLKDDNGVILGVVFQQVAN